MKSLLLDRVMTTTATGAAVTAPMQTTDIYPPFLTTHGLWGISLAEWGQMVGIIFLIIKGASIALSIYRDIRSKKNNMNSEA